MLQRFCKGQQAVRCWVCTSSVGIVICKLYGFQSHCIRILCTTKYTFPIVWCVVYIRFAACRHAEYNTGVELPSLTLLE